MTDRSQNNDFRIKYNKISKLLFMKCGAVLSFQSEADSNVICSVMIGLVLWS